MEQMLSSLSTYGYIILFFYSLGGGMVALIAAGVLSYVGEMDIFLCIIIASIANFIGDSLLFYLSRYNKKEFMPYLRKQRRNLALAHILLKRYGSKIIFIKKYIYGVKTLVPIAIGFTKYPFKKFSILNAFASVLWGLVVGLLSYFAGDLLQRAYGKITQNPLIMPLIILVIFGLIFLYFKKATSKK